MFIIGLVCVVILMGFSHSVKWFEVMFMLGEGDNVYLQFVLLLISCRFPLLFEKCIIMNTTI